MKSKFKDTVNYLQLVECILDAAKQNEELQGSATAVGKGSLL